MAVTYTGEYISVGNKVMSVGKLTVTTVTSGAVAIPGIGKIMDGGALVTPVSSSANTCSVEVNAASAGTATNGMLRIKSASASDIYNVFVIGTP